MFHTALIWTLHRMLRNAEPAATYVWSVTVSLLAVALACLAAEASWRFLENPLIDFGQATVPILSIRTTDFLSKPVKYEAWGAI